MNICKKPLLDLCGYNDPISFPTVRGHNQVDIVIQIFIQSVHFKKEFDK
jgi:hypothetical protein